MFIANFKFGTKTVCSVVTSSTQQQGSLGDDRRISEVHYIASLFNNCLNILTKKALMWLCITTATASWGKGKRRYSSSWEPHLRATGRHLPYGITQVGTRFTYLRGMEGWVDLVDLIVPWPRVEPATFRSRVRRQTAAPSRQQQGVSW